jgi:hypothetical protein
MLTLEVSMFVVWKFGAHVTLRRPLSLKAFFTSSLDEKYLETQEINKQNKKLSTVRTINSLDLRR